MNFKYLPEYLQNVIESSSKCHVDNLGIYRYNHQIAEAIQRYAEEFHASKNPWRPIEEFDKTRNPQVTNLFYCQRIGWFNGYWDGEFFADYSNDMPTEGTHFYDERILPLPKAGE
jgi:hypothetical protein